MSLHAAITAFSATSEENFEMVMALFQSRWALVASTLLLGVCGGGLVTPVGIRSLGAQQTAPDVRVPSALALRDVTVIDVTTGRLRRRQTVVVVGKRIQAVGPSGKVRVPAAASVVDGRGKYLIPGLWEMHIHVKGEPQLAYNLMIANGVTGMREMGTWVPLADQLRMRREIEAGARVGPRLLVTGRLVEIGDDSGANEPMQIRGALFGPSAIARVRTADQGRRLVDSLKAAGADHIKLHDNFSPDVFFAIAREARRVGLRVIGHLPAVAIEAASDSGMRTIEHQAGWVGRCVTQWWGEQPPARDSASLAKCSAFAARLRRNGTWSAVESWMPPSRVTGGTMRARLRYWPRKFWPDTADFSRVDKLRDDPPPGFMPPADFAALAERVGLPLVIVGHVASPDVSGMYPGSGVHDAIAFYVEHGLSPLTALQAATLNPAKYLDGTDSLGTVAVGKLADLVLLDANPLEDIYNTQKIRAVIANGRYFDHAALDSLLVQTGKAQ